jgi:oxygen-independent coproporphyrinogen-3 oxidase
LKYWTAGEYAGFGTAAHSLYMGQRYYVPKDIAAYINAPFQREIPEEEPHSEREEYIMLALRVSEGLDVKKLISLYGEQNTGRLMGLAGVYEKHGLCRIEGSRVSLTPRGYLVSNSIIIEFLHAVGLA